MKHLVSPLDFSVSELETLLTLAETIMDHPEDYQILKVKVTYEF